MSKRNRVGAKKAREILFLRFNRKHELLSDWVDFINWNNLPNFSRAIISLTGDQLKEAKR